MILILSDYFNAVYVDGQLSRSAKAKDLSGEGLMLLYPGAETYHMDEDLYFELVNGEDYPQRIEDVPLERLVKIA